MDDWKREIESRLENGKIYTIWLSKLNEAGSAVSGQQTDLIYKAVDYAYQKSKLIIKNMPEFTLHDGEHLFRVLSLMGKIVPENVLQNLSIPELSLLILTAFFHDIGMAPEEIEIRSYKCDWYGSTPSEEELSYYEEFKRYIKTYPDKIEDIEKLIAQEKHEQANLINSYLISEYIRTSHVERARKIIGKDWFGKILYKEQDLTSSFANLCFSHNEDAMHLLDLDNNVICSTDESINLPFIGVVLRLADILDFDAKRTPSVLFSHLSVRNPVSLLEWQKHRSIRAWKITQNEIIFDAKCSHPAIEASIKKFCDLIDDELKNCNVILSKTDIDNKYTFNIPPRVTRDKIQPQIDITTGEPIYIYHDTEFNLSKNQVIDLLMGTKLYGKPEVALRELLQNSIDACLLSKSLHDKWGIPYEPSITVKYNTIDHDSYLEVIDNGIGMNQDIVDKYYSKIGSSYYQSRDFFDLKADSAIIFTPISRFGIGILSCFMVADTIEIETKRLIGQYEYDDPIKVSIEGYDSIFATYKSKRREPGTTTKLYLRPNKNPWEKLTNSEFISAVKNAVSKPDVPIKISTDKEDIDYTAIDFENIKAESLKDFRWNIDDNIKEVSLDFNENGFQGNAIIAILEKNGNPVTIIDKLSTEIEYNDEKYELSLELEYGDNEIKKSGNNISVSDDGSIKSSLSYTSQAHSLSKFSIHGISFSGGLFPDYYTRNKKTMLHWGIPILLVLDLGGNNDLDLNSARSEVIFNHKWNDFEQKLAKLIFNCLKEHLEKDYWIQLLDVLLNMSDVSENFLMSVKSIKDSLSI